MRVTTGSRTERKQARAIATIAANRKLRPHNDAEAVAQSMQLLNARKPVHETKSIARDIECTTLQPGPCRNAGTYQPTFEASIAPLTIWRVDRLVAAIARIELLQQRDDNCCLVFLHKVPEQHVDRHTLGLDRRDRFGTVVGPMQHMRDTGRRQPGTAIQLRAQQLNRFLDVLFAIIVNRLLAVITPTSFADIFGDDRLVDPSQPSMP